LNADALVETANMMFDLALEVERKTGVPIRFVNLGGGIGIPYRPEQRPVDLERLGAEVKQAYDRRFDDGRRPIRVVMENGRSMTGPYGWLITRVTSKKTTYKSYVGVDACMSNLMRPGMYGAYHHITPLDGRWSADLPVCDVVGSLCENNDKFAVDRPMPSVEVGEALAIHDAGAHGFSMGFQYNGRLRCAEYLIGQDDRPTLIRRAETLDDFFGTIVWNAGETSPGREPAKTRIGAV
jgi:diaminopimelate decarboxylase